MKKHFFKIFTFVFAVILALCMSSCAKKKTATSGGKGISPEDAYKVVLEELVSEYGMPSVNGTSYTGILDFEIVDLNDDGKEELFVICRKGEENFYSAIYTCEKDEAVKSWETNSNDTLNSVYIRKQNGKTCAFLTVSYRGWSSGIIIYEDGKFVDLYNGEEYNADEQKKYNEAAQYGIGAENDAVIEIHLNRIGLSLEDPWEDIAQLSTGDDYAGTEAEMKKSYRKYASECKDKLKKLGIKQDVSAEDLLAKIPYYGDRSICKMDADMAKAYVEAIESMDEIYVSFPGESWSRDFELCALLADPAGDGMPILITAYLNKDGGQSEWEECNENYGDLHEIHMWEYKNGKAVNKNVQKLDYTNGFGEIGGKTYYRSVEFFHDAGHKRAANYYLIENGTVTLKHTVDIYDAYGNVGEEAYFYGELPGGKTYPLTAENLSANGWVEEKHGDFSSWQCIMLDGKNVTEKYAGMWHDEIIGFVESEEIAHINDLEYHITLYNEDAWNVAELLKDYSEN
ncbi:MAG: hypothetical protein E7406_03060 [Ruminococcaceae bacterium]|nr:hypothetical protein [Oscillospiraceae bacterium]